ncbi:MAG: hypothetical protein ABJD68_15255 [Nakamurella sp.]
MSKQMAQIGLPGQGVNILSGDDVDRATGRLLSVAELQQALRLALSTTAQSATRTSLKEPAGRNPAHRTPGGPPVPAPADAEPDAAADHLVNRKESADPDLTDIAVSEMAGTEMAGTEMAGTEMAGTEEWGANPVPVADLGGNRDRTTDRPLSVTRRAPAPTGLPPGVARFPVADLLRRGPRDRTRQALQVLAQRWPGPRRVVVGSLTGGTGRSTTAALICAAATDTGVSVLLLDATGGDGSDLACRVGRPPMRRDWTRLTGTEAAVDFAALRRRSDTNPGNTNRGDNDGAVTVLAVNGDGGAPPPVAAVAAGAAAAAAAGWPLVLVDLPQGQPAIRAAVELGGVDLLVLVCRPDPAEIADSSDFLRDLAAGDPDCTQRAVVAVRADRRGLPTAARRALAGVCDAAAGPVVLTHVPRLTGRRAAANGPDAVAAGRLLAAAAAVTPPAVTPTDSPAGSTHR